MGQNPRSLVPNAFIKGISEFMSRLVVVSNRVAPIQEGEATAGGLAAGVLDALRQKGGIWLGWSGNIRDIPEQQPEQAVGAISLVHDRFVAAGLRSLLPRLRQRHVMAGVALSNRPRPVRVAGIRRLSPGQRDVRPGAGEAGESGRSGLGA